MRLRFVCCWMVELRPCSMCDWTWLNKKNAGISSCAVWNSFVPCFLQWHLLISVSCFRLYLQHVLTIVRISVGIIRVPPLCGSRLSVVYFLWQVRPCFCWLVVCGWTVCHEEAPPFDGLSHVRWIPPCQLALRAIRRYLYRTYTS